MKSYKKIFNYKRIAIFEEGHDEGKASWVARVVEVVEMHFSYCLPSYIIKEKEGRIKEAEKGGFC